MAILWIYLIIYILVLLIVSYFISRKQKQEDFLIAGRNRGAWQIMFSKFAAAIGAGYFITYTGFAYEYGTGVFAMILGIIIGYLFFAYWATPRIHSPSKENKFYKIGDFVNFKLHHKLSVNLSNWMANVILFAWLLVGIVGGAKIINDFGLLSYEVAVLVTVLVVLAYILMSGFRAVLLTDVIQSFIILILLFLITFSLIGSTNLNSLFNVNVGGIDIGTAVSFFLFGVLAVFSYSNMYQLCYCAKNKNKAKHGIGMAIIPVTLISFFLLLIGLFMALNSPGLDSGLVFTEALKNFLPASLLPLAIVLFFAGIMSSADTNIYAISSHYSIGKKGNPIKNIRSSTFFLMLITLIISLLFRDVVDVSIIAGILSGVLSLPMIYLIAGGNSPKKFIASLLMGLVAGIIGMILFGIEPISALPAVFFSALGLLWKH